MADVAVTTTTPEVAGSTGVTTTPTPTAESTTTTPTIAEPEDRIAAKKAAEEAAYWRGVAEGQGRQQQNTSPASAPEPAIKTPGAEPKLESFTDLASYETARTNWIKESAVHEATIAVEKSHKQHQQAEKQQNAVGEFARRIDKAAETDPEIYKIRDAIGYRVKDHTAALIIESEMAPRVLRYLNDNPAEVMKLNSLDPTAAARAMGRIEATIQMSLETSQPKTVSTTPTPIPTVNTGSSGMPDADPDDPESDSMPVEEWARRRNEKVHKRR